MEIVQKKKQESTVEKESKQEIGTEVFTTRDGLILCHG
jgi:hypothetical protein